jgi:glycogen phosphorylase
LHAELMRQTVFSEFHRIYPERIIAETNGITFRRWLHQANPMLTRLLCEACGAEILDDPQGLRRLAELADDPVLIEDLAAVKRANKRALARIVRERLQVRLNPAAIFDVQIKRIHEYKRQLLNLLETAARYLAIRAEPERDWIPRVKIFAGKAAPSYQQAKLIIKLANDLARLINDDPVIGGRLKLVFIPNYNVSLAEAIIPAADLSEQISTAGMEASGTGNMKLALNGAVTIGTLDGANIEIRDRVGAENIVIFGLRAEEVDAHWRLGLDAGAAIAASPELTAVIEALEAGAFSPDDPERFRLLARRLRLADRFMVAEDFAAYQAAQEEVESWWCHPERWGRTTALNIAGMGWFSSDRTISGYARDIWDVPV